MDCHQTSFDEEFNQITAATTAANDLVTTVVGKRGWNGGDLMNDGNSTSNHLDYTEQPHSNNKKMCLNKNNYIERDILGLSNDDMSSADMDQMSNEHLVNHQYNHHQQHHQSHLFVSSGVGGGSGDVVGNHAMISPNFEEDIHRQVQNAIDSILNLQNSDQELHFSLDQGMSFLVESPLGGSVGASGESSTSTTTSQTTQRPPSVAKRKYSQRHQRLDDISDCLIGGGSNLSNSPSPNSMNHTNSSIFTCGGGGGGTTTTQSGPSTSSSASSVGGAGGGAGEFGVGVGSLIDETVKSIITS
jgi:hypothetical protein